MALRLYNTFSKREEDFKPLKAGIVTMYTCGPTVYGRPHIGNYSSFLMADLLRRWLEVGHRYTVKHVKNITDVGHLLADRDDGEDKIEKQARLERGSTDARAIDPLAVAKRYTEMYLEDEKALNLIEPEARPRATEYVQEMLAIIKILLKKGNAYETPDGFYFSVETFPAYGKLSGNTLDKLDAGARVAIDEAKRHPADFALWKKCVGGNGHHFLRWSFASGERSETEGDDPASGFPGWHIECSAMSSKLLGDEIDLHTGGEDNIFPHHECEIAQSESSTGHQFVRFWLHKRRIDLAGEKMSKSLGNVLSVPAVVEKGYSPLDLRYYLLSIHYRTNLKFSWKGMDDARKEREKIIEWIAEVEASGGEGMRDISMKDLPGFFGAAGKDQLLGKLRDSFDADLNTPAARACIFDAMSEFRTHKKSLNTDQLRLFRYYILAIREIFGCFEPEQAAAIPAPVQALIAFRAKARASKDFKESDRLRDEIKKLGYEVRDEIGEQKVRKL